MHVTVWVITCEGSPLCWRGSQHSQNTPELMVLLIEVGWLVARKGTPRSMYRIILPVGEHDACPPPPPSPLFFQPLNFFCIIAQFFILLKVLFLFVEKWHLVTTFTCIYLSTLGTGYLSAQSAWQLPMPTCFTAAVCGFFIRYSYYEYTNPASNLADDTMFARWRGGGTPSQIAQITSIIFGYLRTYLLAVGSPLRCAEFYYNTRLDVRGGSFVFFFIEHSITVLTVCTSQS